MAAYGAAGLLKCCLKGKTDENLQLPSNKNMEFPEEDHYFISFSLGNFGKCLFVGFVSFEGSSRKL